MKHIVLKIEYTIRIQKMFLENVHILTNLTNIYHLSNKTQVILTAAFSSENLKLGRASSRNVELTVLFQLIISS